jgi:hypothetical protein
VTSKSHRRGQASSQTHLAWLLWTTVFGAACELPEAGKSPLLGTCSKSSDCVDGLICRPNGETSQCCVGAAGLCEGSDANSSTDTKLPSNGDTSSNVSDAVQDSCSCTEDECGVNACGQNCGGCPAGQQCSGGTCQPTACPDGVCPCIPQCSGRECGEDGCGGVCGDCNDDDELECTYFACDESTGQCERKLQQGCLIDDICRDDAEVNPENSCEYCNEESPSAWTAALSGGCDDGDGCTTGDSCQGGSCLGNVVFCDDGLSCTTDSCTDGTCAYAQVIGTCAFGGKCLTGGQTSSLNQCQYCDPDSPKSPSNRPDGQDCGLPGSGSSCFGGVCCTPDCNGKKCGSNGCGGTCGTCEAGWTCDSASSKCTCTPDCTDKTCGSDGCGGLCGAGDCDDGISCTNDVCLDGSCQNDLLSGWCLVAKECLEKDEQSVVEPCKYCDPVNPYSLTSFQNGKDCGDSGATCQQGKCCQPNCGGRQCGSDGCGGTCGPGCSGKAVCQPDVGKCVCTPTCAEKKCGSDDCGGTCGTCNDGLDCTADSCAADGQCSFTTNPGWCKVNNQCFPSNVTQLNEPCLVCNPTVNVTQFTVLGDGTDCGSAGGVCFNGKCCDRQKNCENRQCGSDGCGGNCGTCPSNSTCIPSTGQCQCQPNCAGRECGSDGCGGVCGSCNDGLLCTTDSCSALGQCSFITESGWCKIAGQCVPSNVTQLNEPCLVCNPTVNASQYTVLGDGTDCGSAGGVCFNGKCCDRQKNCENRQCGSDGCGGNCGTCPSNSTCIQGTGQCQCQPNCAGRECGSDGCGGSCGPTCNDGLACTLDSCSMSGTCMATVTNGCMIGNKCYSEDEKPAGNTCQVCDPSQSTLAWTNLTGLSCSDNNLCTLNDKCSVGACIGQQKACSDSVDCTIDSCFGGTCFNLLASQAGCLIAEGGKNTCYPEGAVNPKNECQACVGGVSQSAWSPISGVVTCDDDDLCTDAGLCSGGACDVTPKLCEMPNECVAGACVCVPKCDGSTCGSDGCGGTCPCDAGYNCVAELCELACIPDCTEGYDCMDGSCVQVEPVTLFATRMGNMVSPPYPQYSASTDFQLKMFDGTQRMKIGRGTVQGRQYGVAPTTLKGEAKDFSVVAQIVGAIQIWLEPIVPMSFPADRFEVTMHISRKEANNSGLNGGLVGFQFFPDSNESSWYWFAMLAWNCEGDAQKDICIEFSTGLKNQNPSSYFFGPSPLQPQELAYPYYSPFNGAGMYVRFQSIGTSFRLKYWDASAVEPTTWKHSGQWAPPPVIDHWRIIMTANMGGDNTPGGAAFGSMLLRRLPETGWDAPLGPDYPPSAEVGGFQ